jgi:ribonucleases P/MRP protein subunit RPP40
MYVQAEFILPEELYESVKDSVFGAILNPRYCKVILPLKAILEGEFFNEYIKKGQ